MFDFFYVGCLKCVDVFCKKNERFGSEWLFRGYKVSGEVVERL